MAASMDIRSPTGQNGWSAIRRELGVQSFGVNSWTRDKGETVVADHDEAGSAQEELYVVVAGSAQFTVDGEEIAAPAGTAVFVGDPASKRKAVASENGTTILVMGGKAGEAYAPGPWEVNVEVFGLFQQDRIEEAKQLIVDALAQYGDTGPLTYNLACAEARLGDTEPAVEHLRAALDQRPGLAELAREDTDLDAIRDDPRFVELVGSSG